MTRPLEDRYLLTEPELKDRLAFGLGGRAAEELVFEEISTGAMDDLQKATELARAMVVEFGMSPKIGPLFFGRDGFRGGDGRLFFPGDRPDMSEQTAQVVDSEVARLVNEAHQRAQEILLKDRALLSRLSDVLVTREVIEGKDLRQYVEGERPIPGEEELRREREERAIPQAEAAPGPAVIPSAAGDREASPAQVPSRPDA
jgi:cell division protease FtsH